MSIRYIRMKPRIRDTPIQACGLRPCVASSALGVEESVRMPTSPGSVGVLGGSAEKASAVRPSGRTGPGTSLKASLSSGVRNSRMGMNLSS